MSGYTQQFGTVFYDLANVFEANTSGNADKTNYQAKTKDLNTLFQPLSNQKCNLTVNYNGLVSAFQSFFFNPVASYTVTPSAKSITVDITSAAFNTLTFEGDLSGNVTGASGTSTYQKIFSSLLPDAKYSFNATPSNTGTSPGQPTTKNTGTKTSWSSVNTLPMIKGLSATPGSTTMAIAWGATGQADCSYSSVTLGRATTSTGTPTLLKSGTSTSIANTVTTFSDTGLTANQIYYYTLTPFNASGSAGTAVTANGTTVFPYTINNFSANAIISFNGDMRFNVDVSGTPDFSISNGTTIQYATGTTTSGAFSGTIDIYVGAGVLSTPLTYVLTIPANGGPGAIAKSIKINFKSSTYSTSSSADSGWPFNVSCTAYGGGGGGGGGGRHGGGGAQGGGGGGAGGRSIAAKSLTYPSICSFATAKSTFNVVISSGAGGAGGAGGSSDGVNGSAGSDGGSSSVSITNIGITTITAGGGGGGGGGDNGRDNQYYGAGGKGGTGDSNAGTDGNGKTGGAGTYGRNGAGGAGGVRTFKNDGGNGGSGSPENGSKGADGYCSVTIYYVTSVEDTIAATPYSAP